MIAATTFHFLSELKENNNREWFLANKKRYEAAKKDVEQFIDEVVKAFSKSFPSIADIKAKDTLFRINRDVRFSTDKSPYKTNFGAVISENGKKSEAPAFYLQIQPDNCFVAAGKWMPSSEELKRIRQEIDYNAEQLQQVFALQATSIFFKDFDQESKLIRAPKGYEESNPNIEWLKLKSFTISTQLMDSELQKNTAIALVTDAFQAATPIVSFLRLALKA